MANGINKFRFDTLVHPNLQSIDTAISIFSVHKGIR